MGEMIITLLDDDGEATVVTYPCEDLTAANITAKTAAGDALALALEDITGCIVVSKVYVAKRSKISALHKSANPEGNREARWLHRFYDTTTFTRYTLTTPGPLIADKNSADPKFADLADTEIAAYKSAFEAFVKPSANVVTLEEMEWVGRNL